MGTNNAASISASLAALSKTLLTASDGSPVAFSTESPDADPITATTSGLSTLDTADTCPV